MSGFQSKSPGPYSNSKKVDIVRVLAILDGNFQMRRTPEQQRIILELWTQELAKFDPETIRNAALNLCQRSRFFPVLAEIIDVCSKLNELVYEATPHQNDPAWSYRVAAWREDGYWAENWGPEPNSPAFKAKHLVEAAA